ncbi:helix-turn-helix transcriptional regulator [Actinoplanes sp. KI2]|uniref:helix-turn-helix domain-containing protein n=1 Tax=Actinoplanes sp. KI2 TaxID=2983315 RepID=UPI0021D5BA93|nr:helix-turn-helix transcriptional regulator [Actinoplanes sp. KI2]MCU7726066.1 helix-turn-helix transcriptional regulator [Actinoplanes sp. KI2]
MPLRPLDEHQAHRLLLALAPDLADPVATGIMATAAGNPGVLTELGEALSLAQRRGFAPLPAGLPPHGPLAARLRAAVAALPAATRDALLLLAVEPTHITDLSALSAAEATGLVTISPDGCAHFVPRILRAGIYREAPAGARRAAHLVAAERLDGLAALTHRAAAALGRPDSGLAHRLATAAAGAAPAPAAIAFRYAAALADDPSRLLLNAARSFWLAGRPDEALPLLHRAASHGGTTRPTGPGDTTRPGDTTSPLPRPAGNAIVRARARGLIAEIGLRGDPLPARDALLDVAGELLPYDRPGALSALLLAGEACCRAGDPGRFVALAAALDFPSTSAGLDLATPSAGVGPPSTSAGLGPPSMSAELGLPSASAGLGLPRASAGLGPSSPSAGLGVPWTSVGEALAVRQVRGLASLLQGQDESAFTEFRAVLDLAARVGDPSLLVGAAMAGIVVGQDRRAAALARRAAAAASASGAYALVPAALEAVAYAELAAGRHDAATAAALDGAAAASRYGRLDLADSLLALLAVLAALVGDRATGEHRCRAATARHEEARDLADWAYALLDLVEGHPAPAAERLGAIVAAPPGRGSTVLRVAVIPHLIEAAGAAPGLDAPALQFDRWARRTGEAAWLAMSARCRALRARDAGAADDHFREALRRHDAGFALAHTELLYGRHLRRRRRSLEARGHLRHAAETFQRLDAGPWAAQAARELRAAGERAPAPVSPGIPARPAPAGSPGPPLTAQQERIAGLVADGATNREVAQQLHLSPRTVDHHLRNVFARLGVRSRTELARVLND